MGVGTVAQVIVKNLIFVDDRFLELGLIELYLIFHHCTTMAAETEQFTTVIMVLPADDLVDYFSLENKPSFSYLCTVSDRYSFGIGIGRYIGLADMGKAYRLSVSGDKIVYIGSLPIKYKIG